jgi:hypothetical protein
MKKTVVTPPCRTITLWLIEADWSELWATPVSSEELVEGGALTTRKLPLASVLVADGDGRGPLLK